LSFIQEPGTKTNQRVAALAGLSGIAAAATLVLRFPPEHYAFYPRCPFREYLHLACPGCGATRAFAALLHGHVVEALHFNALFVGVVPLLAIYAGSCGYRAWTRKIFSWPEVAPWALYALLFIASIFGVARNLQG
jgi:hypothetical protein